MSELEKKLSDQLIRLRDEFDLQGVKAGFFDAPRDRHKGHTVQTPSGYRPRFRLRNKTCRLGQRFGRGTQKTSHPQFALGPFAPIRSEKSRGRKDSAFLQLHSNNGVPLGLQKQA